MRVLLRVCQLGMILAILPLSGKAFAQGCDLGIATGPECFDSAHHATANGAWCGVGYGFAPPAQECQYCYMGHGACPVGSTGSLTTANWGYDESCCEECEPPGGGCSGG